MPIKGKSIYPKESLKTANWERLSRGKDEKREGRREERKEEMKEREKEGINNKS